jgi:hypothetical protein
MRCVSLIAPLQRSLYCQRTDYSGHDNWKRHNSSSHSTTHGFQWLTSSLHANRVAICTRRLRQCLGEWPNAYPGYVLPTLVTRLTLSPPLIAGCYNNTYTGSGSTTQAYQTSAARVIARINGNRTIDTSVYVTDA